MILLLIFLLGSAALVTTALIRPLLIYQYPYFMGATFLAFIGPQAYALYVTQWGEVALETTFLVACLCLAACWWGYSLRPHPGLVLRLNVRTNASRRLHVGVLFVLVGFACSHLIEQLPEDEKGSMWTGIVTIYAFFGQLIYPGFAICLYSALTRRSIMAWLAVCVAAAIPLEHTFLYARREATVHFLLTLGLTVFFVRGKQAPRWVIVCGVLGAMLFIPATGDYRSYAQTEGALEALKQTDFVESFKGYFDVGSDNELKNATILIAATQESGDYGLGAEYWNRIVSRFVPAQVFGEAFKTSLIIGEQRHWSEVIATSTSYNLPTGTTVTGLGDSFNQFGYLGCLVFAAIGYLFKNLWTAAIEPNATIAQILYIQVTTSAMRALTHQTIDFLPGFIYGGIFIGALAVYAKERSRPELVRSEGACPPYSARGLPQKS